MRQHVRTSDKKVSKIIKALRKGKLVAASDGSAYSKVRATFAFCFAKRKTGKKLYKAHSPVLMDPEYANSDRAELCGLLAIVAQLLELSTNAERWLNGEEKRKVYIYTDSASSITRIEKKIHPSTKNVMLSNLDVILEVQQILNKLPFNVKLVHVKAHQDENCSYKELSILF